MIKRRIFMATTGEQEQSMMDVRYAHSGALDTYVFEPPLEVGQADHVADYVSRELGTYPAVYHPSSEEDGVIGWKSLQYAATPEGSHTTRATHIASALAELGINAQLHEIPEADYRQAYIRALIEQAQPIQTQVADL
jgi:hypothetical protein